MPWSTRSNKNIVTSVDDNTITRVATRRDAMRCDVERRKDESEGMSKQEHTPSFLVTSELLLLELLLLESIGLEVREPGLPT